MIEVSNSSKRQADNSESPETMPLTSKKNCYSTAKRLHSTSFYLKFRLVTEHKVPFKTTCEITKGRETET